MPSDRSVCDDITTRLMPLGPVTGRVMFGGFGIFMDGLMFGLIADSDLYLKVDAENRPAFKAAGSHPFTYEGKSKPVQMSCWKVTEQMVNDPKKLIEWASAAFAAARRAKKAKRQARWCN
jgi:DNA transformation protein